LNDDFRKEIKLIGALTLDQAYVIKQDHGLFIKSQWIKCQDPYSILLDINLGMMVLC